MKPFMSRGREPESNPPSFSRERYEQSGVAMTCRSFAEYAAMFGLEPEAFHGIAVADVAAGASSFCAGARAAGADAYAFDPRFGEPLGSWAQSAREEIELSTAKLDALKETFDWSYYGTLERHHAERIASWSAVWPTEPRWRRKEDIWRRCCRLCLRRTGSSTSSSAAISYFYMRSSSATASIATRRWS